MTATSTAILAGGCFRGVQDLIRVALEQTAGNTDGEALVTAMRGKAWTSPRGPMTIDAATRDVIQNVYIRRCERVDGELFNVEFATVENVRDPGT